MPEDTTMLGALQSAKADYEKIKEEQAQKVVAFTSSLLNEKAIRDLDVAPTEWMLPGFLPKPALVAITGKPGSFKTFFAHWIARRLASGQSLFDTWEGNVESKLSTAPWDGYKKRKVLIVEEEMGPEIIKERCQMMKSWGEEENVYWAINSGFSIRGDKGEHIKGLIHSISTLGIDVVILDPFTSVSGMEDENDNAEAREVMDILLKELVNNGPKITVIFLHHPAKGDGDGTSIRGAGDILGKAYVHYTLQYDKTGGEGPKKITIKCGKTRWRQLEDFTIEFRDEPAVGLPPGVFAKKEFVYTGQKKDDGDGDGDMDGDEKRGKGRPSNKEENKALILDGKDPAVGYTRNEIAESAGLHVRGRGFLVALMELKTEGKVVEDEKIGKWYFPG